MEHTSKDFSVEERRELKGAPAHFACTKREAFIVSGSDARTFLQSKLTADLKRRPAGSGGYAVAVDINGRVIFDADVISVPSAEGESFVFVSEPGFAEVATTHFDRYIIMESVELESLSSTHTVIELAHPDAAAIADGLIASAGARFVVDAYRSPATHKQVIVESDQLEGARRFLADQALQEVDAGLFAALEVELGIPRVGRDVVAGKHIPLEVGLHPGVHFNKGCYLGQEVIERLDARGAPSRQMMRVRWHGDGVASGTPVLDSKGAAGHVTACVRDAEGTLGLAIIRRRALDGEGLSLEGTGQTVELMGRVGVNDES